MFRLALAGASVRDLARRSVAAKHCYPMLGSERGTTRTTSSGSAAAMSTSCGGRGRGGDVGGADSITQRLASLLIHGPPSVEEDDDDDDDSAAPPDRGSDDALNRLTEALRRSSSPSSSFESSFKYTLPPPPPLSAVLALSGGAVRSSSALATTPGSSSILRECIFPYDRTSYADFVSSRPLPPPEVLNGIETSASASAGGRKGGKGATKGFSFSGPESAILLSHAAMHRSMELAGSLGDMRGCVGTGCSAALVSGDPNRISTVHVAVTTVDGTTEIMDVALSSSSKSKSKSKSKSSSKSASDDDDADAAAAAAEGCAERNKRRDRAEEDEAASALLLLAMIKNRYAGGIGIGGGGNDDDDGGSIEEAVDLVVASILDREGDASDGRIVVGGVPPGDDPIRRSVRRVLSSAPSLSSSSSSSSSATTAALLLPSPSFSPRNSTFVPVAAALHASLPPDPLIFPGSFNPPHVGHVALANAAVRTMDRKRREEWKLEREWRARGHRLAQRSFLSTADSIEEEEEEGERDLDDNDNNDNNDNNDDDDGGPFSDGGPSPPIPMPTPTPIDGVWSAIEYHNHKSRPSILFEMSLMNPDKPPMDESEAARRVGLFGRCLDHNAHSSDASGDDEGDCGGDDDAVEEIEMPEDWGVLLTSAPLFVEKVEALGGILAPTGSSYVDGRKGGRRRRKMTFVIGTDTMVRIIDPKYYGNDRESMLGAVRDMGDAGAHFVVGGRLEQGMGEGEESRFVTGEEELLSLPEDVQSMFTIIQEEDFRLDLSSTEIRKRMQT